MRRSKVLSKLNNGGFARMSATGHFLPFFIRHSAWCNYDGIWLDLEHRTMDDREVQAFIAACYYNDIDCMVRTPTLERSRLYHYLDDGATGFMVPFVSTPEIAQQVVDAVKFPPSGNRGIDGAGLDGDYGIEAWKPGTTYFDDANRETFVVAQIETPEAVENVEEIAAIPGIDLLFIGPGDLGYRLSVTRSSINLDDVMERVSAAAARQGKAWGRTAGSIEEVEAYRKLGAQMIPWGGDFALVKVLQQCGQELDSILEGA